ncbi:S-layer homology domain-containing protein [Paenibacillus sp. YPG26]|uniref:S-layer homology domain-containing protein n=1 Tax=Paenibacillus sp. YPG26 TaxID=2878915 RepID=UPI002040F502|nr:S-layer homology domain-containing protein [Paenibacillus sp. YPG26]USB31783.1 S-layer homology domain-containing protein [Paenibacillus sp. YPG26]
MKKIVHSAAAALLLTLSLHTAQVSAKTSADFSDLKDLDAATKAKFDAMISSGIFEGVQEGRFDLKDQMNRAQFAKVAALILKLEVNSGLKTSSFTDVKADDPANGYALPFIEALKQSGITQGDGNPNLFNPAGDVTKEELAAFLVRSLKLPVTGKNRTDEFSGVSDWAKGYVAAALQYKIMDAPQNVPDWQSGASRKDLVLGSYETKTQLDPLKLVSASATDQHELSLLFSASLKESQVDLSKIFVSGKPLDKTKAHFKLSQDGKTLTIIFDELLSPEVLNQPIVSIQGFESIAGKPLTTDHPVPIQQANLLPSTPSPTPPSNGGGYNPPADTTAPQLITVTRQGSGNSIQLIFSEALNEASASNSSSYELEVKGDTSSTFTNLPDGSNIQVSADKKQVTITFPETFTINDSTYTVPSYFTGNVGVQVSGVLDLAGNRLTKINKPVVVVNPGLTSPISFVKPAKTNDNVNKTQPVIGQENANEPLLHNYRYVIGESAVPVVIGLPYNSEINGDVWEGSNLLDSGTPILIEDNRRTITVIDYYNDEHNEQVQPIVYGYQSFEITENQVLREDLLSKPISFTEKFPAVWTAAFSSLEQGHSYYYQVGNSPVPVDVKYKELAYSWAHSYELTLDSTIQAASGQYITVIEVVPVSEVSKEIIAHQSFRLTSTAPVN